MAKSTIVGLFGRDHDIHNLEEDLDKKYDIKGKRIHAINWEDISEKEELFGLKKEKRDEDEARAKLIEGLRDRGVPEDDARDFAEAVRQGNNLLVTEVDDDQEADQVAHYLDERGAIDLDDQRRQWRSSGEFEGREFEEEGGVVSEGEEANLEEAREELKVGKREKESGKVRIHKRVEETPVEEDVSLREEHVDVEREKVDRPSTEGEGAFEEESFEMTEHAEEPVVEKETRVEEEVHVGKRGEEHTETVQDTVRESHIDIEEVTSGLTDDDYSRNESDFREHHTSTFGDSGGAYGEYEPAYRFGYGLGSHERYGSQDYNSLEPDVRRTYESEYGEGSYDDHRDAIEYGFKSARERENR
ncbi:MAG: YsnF/AvaK domain-containing protein [Persicimonas sp.]